MNVTLYARVSKWIWKKGHGWPVIVVALAICVVLKVLRVLP